MPNGLLEKWKGVIDLTKFSMELVFGIGNIGIGALLTLIGFKFYNPFKGKNEPEK